MSPRAPHRFYYPGPLAGSADGMRVAMPPEEAHHMAHVLRLRPGMELELFDADGLGWRAELDTVAKNGAVVRLLAALEAEPLRATPPVGLAVAVIKRNPMDWMIEKLSELGVRTLQPLLTARSIGQGDIKPGAPPPERWERLAIAAAKQCGRNRPLELAAPATLAGWLTRPQPESRLFFADTTPEAPPLGRALLEGAEAPPAPGALIAEPPPVWIAIGPEGGWTPEERDALRGAGYRPVLLGGLILRTETAALAAAAICQGIGI